MADNKRYNGWANYETWNVALWIDNDQGSYETRQEMAQQAWDDAKDQRGYASQTRDDSAKYLLSEALKSWVEEMQPDLGASMFADLLSAALSEVDWYEMAENFLEDVDGFGEAEGVCKHCGATGVVGEECDNCEPQDDLGPMVYQAVEVKG